MLVALALNGVPIDVLADRLAHHARRPYKALHDARRNLRRRLRDVGPSTRRRKRDERAARSAADIERLLGPAAPEIGCDECFDELDRYVELELAGAAPTRPSRPGAHLVGCPACREDYESLLALLADDAAGPPA